MEHGLVPSCSTQPCLKRDWPCFSCFYARSRGPATAATRVKPRRGWDPQDPIHLDSMVMNVVEIWTSTTSIITDTKTTKKTSKLWGGTVDAKTSRMKHCRKNPKDKKRLLHQTFVQNLVVDQQKQRAFFTDPKSRKHVKNQPKCASVQMCIARWSWLCGESWNINY